MGDPALLLHWIPPQGLDGTQGRLPAQVAKGRPDWPWGPDQRRGFGDTQITRNLQPLLAEGRPPH